MNPFRNLEIFFYRKLKVCSFPKENNFFEPITFLNGIYHLLYGIDFSFSSLFFLRHFLKIPLPPVYISPTTHLPLSNACKLAVVVGDPIMVEKVPQPTEKEVLDLV